MTNRQLIHLKNATDTKLIKLVEDDSVTYSVLCRILKEPCTDIFHNNESVIVCYSAPPYPIWVWCKNESNADDLANIAECIKTNFPLEKHEVIMSHALLGELKKYDAYFKNVSFKMELFSYRLNTLKEINYPCEGQAELATPGDVSVLSPFFKDMHYEMEGRVFSIEECEEKARNMTELKQLYAWRNSKGEIVALTSKKIDGIYARVSTVYTLPSERRKGYAINLVHTISKELLSEGKIPILYTNGSYAASNECYKKIGFEQVGRLCNIQK